MPRLLILFSLVNLVIGTGAFVISGILGPISTDLQVSLPATGQAMTVYAMSTAVLAPLMLVLTRRWTRKHAMLLALAIFCLGNLVCALATQLPVLLAGRVLMGMGAMFTPLAAGIAVATTEPARRGRALALVAAFMVWGTAGFGMLAPQQARLAALSPPHAPLLLSLNSSMLYFGTAAGAAAGGAALGHGVAFTHLVWVGVPFAALGGLTLWAGAGRQPDAQRA